MDSSVSPQRNELAMVVAPLWRPNFAIARCACNGRQLLNLFSIIFICKQRINILLSFSFLPLIRLTNVQSLIIIASGFSRYASNHHKAPGNRIICWFRCFSINRCQFFKLFLCQILGLFLPFSPATLFDALTIVSFKCSTYVHID